MVFSSCFILFQCLNASSLSSSFMICFHLSLPISARWRHAAAIAVTPWWPRALGPFTGDVKDPYHLRFFFHIFVSLMCLLHATAPHGGLTSLGSASVVPGGGMPLSMVVPHLSRHFGEVRKLGFSNHIA